MTFAGSCSSSGRAPLAREPHLFLELGQEDLKYLRRHDFRTTVRLPGPATMLSKSCEYGLRAMLYLAADEPDGYVPIGTISDALDISFPFLTKIFQKLNDAGHLTSQRGPKGGVALTTPADEMTLYEVVVAIDGDDLFEECVLGLPGCGEERPCPLHDRWTDERERVEEIFQSTTLAEMAQRIHGDDLRLTAF